MGAAEDEIFKTVLINPLWDLKLRYCAYVVRKRKHMNHDERSTDSWTFAEDMAFPLRMTINPGFYRFIVKRLHNVGWIKEHKKELAKLLLVDLLQPVATLKKAINVSDKSYTYRHRRRIIKEYPELFFTPPEGSITELDDNRASPFNSIFTVDYFFDEEEKIEARKLVKMMHVTQLPYEAEYKYKEILIQGIRSVEPLEIEEYIEFWQFLIITLNNIIKAFKICKDKDWIIKDIQDGKEIVFLLYQLVTDSVAFKWFRQRSRRERKLLLMKNRPLRYSKEEARQGINAILRLPISIDESFNRVVSGAKAYLSYNKSGASLLLLKEWRNQINWNSVELKTRGVFHDNLAGNYRDMGKPKKAFAEYKKAQKIWANLEEPYHRLLSTAYMAEAIYYFGDETLGVDTMNKVFDSSPDPLIDDNRLAALFINISFAAKRVNNLHWERRALEQCLDPLSRIDSHNWFIYVNKRLIDISNGVDSPDPFRVIHEFDLPFHLALILASGHEPHLV